MDRDGILRLLRGNTADVLCIDPATIDVRAKLSEIGANSMDRMEIITLTMDTLKLNFPLMDLGGVESIDALATVFEQKRGTP